MGRPYILRMLFVVIISWLIQVSSLLILPDHPSSTSPQIIGPPDESVYRKCSHDQPEFCPSVDLAHAYDYDNVTVAGSEWYTVR